ncbi:hypothetical protein HC762_00435 [bacterium]|nr:hypothetical protein [bacterium]
MPPNDDVSKPYTVSNEFIASRNCGGGTGRANYEAVAKPAKLKVKISGSDQDLDVMIVELEGKWQAGSCGTGRQYQKITYSKQLDQVLETEIRNFLPNGFLNFGRISRIVSVN